MRTAVLETEFVIERFQCRKSLRRIKEAEYTPDFILMDIFTCQTSWELRRRVNNRAPWETAEKLFFSPPPGDHALEAFGVRRSQYLRKTDFVRKAVFGAKQILGGRGEEARRKYLL